MYHVFNWRIIALQCCVGFCHTAKCISHNYIYAHMHTHTHTYTHTNIYIYSICICTSSHMSLPPHLHPSLHRALGGAPCAIQQLPTSQLVYTGYCVYVNATFPVHRTLFSLLFPSLTVSTCPFCKSAHPLLPGK